MEEKVIVLSEEQLAGVLGLKGRFGLWLTRRLMHLLDIDKVNEIQSRHPSEKGPDFSALALQDVGVRYDLDPAELKNIPASGGFITVSNHHFGSIDGLILDAVIGGKRPDYKLLTTFVLAMIPGLKEDFLPVDNLSGDTADARSVNGIRAALRHIAGGGSIGFFPAGEVATWQHRKKRGHGGFFTIQDKPWAPNIIKLIKRSGLPVIPVSFEGRNSLSFHLLGLIHPRLRTLRLVHEMFNKRGQVVKVHIGKALMPAELEAYPLEELGSFLRGCCYPAEYKDK